MPSFQPRNGFSSDDSTIAGRTTAMAAAGFASRKLRISDSERLLVNVYVLGQPSSMARREAGVGERLAQPAHAIFADLIFQRGALQVFRRVFFFCAARRSSSVISADSARASVSRTRFSSDCHSFTASKSLIPRGV